MSGRSSREGVDPGHSTCWFKVEQLRIDGVFLALGHSRKPGILIGKTPFSQTSCEHGVPAAVERVRAQEHERRVAVLINMASLRERKRGHHDSVRSHHGCTAWASQRARHSVRLAPRHGARGIAFATVNEASACFISPWVKAAADKGGGGFFHQLACGIPTTTDGDDSWEG